MPGWDIDDEEKPQFSGNAGGKEVVGKPHYMMVIHYPGLRPKHFKPQHVEKDATGKPIPNPFAKGTPKLEEGDPQSVFNRLTHSWKGLKTDLDAMDKDTRSLCNSLKALFNKHQIALFYHNSLRDECALFRGEHLHIVYKSEVTGNGEFQALWQRKEWTTIMAKCKEVGGYARCEAVRKLPETINHFLKPPRICLGTSSPEYGRLMQKSRAKEIIDVMFEELGDKTEMVQEVDNDQCCYNDFDDDAPAMKRAKNDFGEEQPFLLPVSYGGPVTIKESEKDAWNRVLSVLCSRWNAWTSKALYRAAGEKAEIESEKKYCSLWWRLSSKSGITQVIANVRSRAEAITMFKPFAQLIDEYCATVVEEYDNDDGVLDPKQSYLKMLAWFQWQKIDALSFLDNVFDIMDKNQPKINTLMILGPPNSGKSSMVSVPLRAICKHVGQIGNRGANSEFIYMECLNKRMIAIDECIMNPSNLEDFKLLTAGENLKSNVKQQGYEDVVRTPCIMTGNKKPWILDESAGPAFETRMIQYTVVNCPDLEDIKSLSPKMWWYLMQLKTCRSVTDVEKLDITHGEPPAVPAELHEEDLN